MADPIAAQPKTDEAGYFEGYVSFARTLRTWLVAFGIGAPVLLLSQEQLAVRFMASDKAALVTTCFLAGVGAQVLGALLYKTAMWYLYLGELKPAFKKSARYRASDRVSEAFVIESLLDLASIGLFGYATYLLISTLATR